MKATRCSRPLLTALLLGLAAAAGCSEPVQAPARFEGPRPRDGLAAEVTDALLIEDSLERVAAVSQLLAGLGEAAVPDVVAAYDYARPVIGDSEWMLLADWWTRYQPRAAYAWVLSDREHKTPGVLRYVIAGMARHDQEAALLALATLRQKEHRDAAFNEIVRSWYQVDPEAVLAHLVEMKPGADRQRAISTLVALKVRREGVEAAQRFAESLDDDLLNRFKLQTFRRLVTELALADVDVARAWVERHETGPHGNGLARRASMVTVYDDPEGTLAWLAGRPAGLDRDQAVEDVYRRWLEIDEPAALAWAASAPREPWLARAYEIYALSHSPADPDKALALAAEIQDVERRRYAEARIVSSWFNRDEAAASAWLESSDMPDELKRKVLDRVARAEQRRLKNEERARRRELRMQERAGSELAQ